MLEALVLQTGNQLLPIHVVTVDEWLRDQNVDAAFEFEHASKTDVVTKEVVRQQVVRQVIEEAVGRLVERITLVIEQAGVIILDHEPLFANDRDLVFQTAGEAVARVRE